MEYVKGDFFIVPNRSALKGIHYRERATFTALCDMADNNGRCWPSYQTLADHAGMSRDSAIESIQALISRGLISKTNRGREDGSQTSNEYQICLLAGGSGQEPLGGSGCEPLGVVARIPTNDNQLERKNDLEQSSRSFSSSNAPIEVEEVTSVSCDDWGEEVTTKPKKSNNSHLVKHFLTLAEKNTNILPMVNMAAANKLLQAAKQHLTEEQIKDMFDDWFYTPKPDHELLQITRALSIARINQYKASNGIK